MYRSYSIGLKIVFIVTIVILLFYFLIERNQELINKKNIVDQLPELNLPLYEKGSQLLYEAIYIDKVCGRVTIKKTYGSKLNEPNEACQKISNEIKKEYQKFDYRFVGDKSSCKFYPFDREGGRLGFYENKIFFEKDHNADNSKKKTFNFSVNSVDSLLDKRLIEKNMFYSAHGFKYISGEKLFKSYVFVSIGVNNLLGDRVELNIQNYENKEGCGNEKYVEAVYVNK